MPFSLHLHSEETPEEPRVLPRLASALQFIVVFAGAFVLFDAAMTGGEIMESVLRESFSTASHAKQSLAAALLR